MNCVEVEDISVATPNSTSVSLPPSGRDSTDSLRDSPRLRRSLWEQEILTPDQFVHPARESLAAWTGRAAAITRSSRGSRPHVPQILSGALSAREKQLFGEVEEWFLSQDSHRLYAFESICSHLGFDPDCIRTGLQRGHERAIATTLPWQEKLLREEQPTSDRTQEERLYG